MDTVGAGDSRATGICHDLVKKRYAREDALDISCSSGGLMLPLILDTAYTLQQLDFAHV